MLLAPSSTQVQCDGCLVGAGVYLEAVGAAPSTAADAPCTAAKFGARTSLTELEFEVNVFGQPNGRYVVNTDVAAVAPAQGVVELAFCYDHDNEGFGDTGPRGLQEHRSSRSLPS